MRWKGGSYGCSALFRVIVMIKGPPLVFLSGRPMEFVVFRRVQVYGYKTLPLGARVCLLRVLPKLSIKGEEMLTRIKVEFIKSR